MKSSARDSQAGYFDQKLQVVVDQVELLFKSDLVQHMFLDKVNELIVDL